MASEPPRAPGCYTVSFLGVQQPGHCVDHPPYLVPRLKKFRTICVLPSRGKLEIDESKAVTKEAITQVL